MATRAKEDEVIAILDTALTAAEIAPFCTTANIIVTNACSGAGYNDATLKQIELYLAAHLVTIRDPRIKSQGIGAATVSYDLQRYVDQIKMLDSKHRLDTLLSGKGQADLKAY